ncbi:MAG: CehA/McbA family metallohydrolase, partial [Acidimicrobiales bacterium]
MVTAVAAVPGVAPAQDGPPPCAPGGAPVTFSGHAVQGDARSYRALAFDVAEGTTRVEVTYDWTDPLPSTPITQTVFDLGLWDADGLGTAEGFRGWSGSRGGRVSHGQAPVFVQPDAASRGYRPAPIEAGIWHADLGIAAVGPLGADWTVTATCTAPDVGPAFTPQPVDAMHVADPNPGWYHGDFHMHGYHSNARAPSWQEMVDYARSVGLDFLPVTEYVTGQHWDELGPVQEANPDVVIWPGREIITYFGHAIALGETRSVLDFRHGYPGVSLRDIQAASVADGALFQVAHPTIFPGPVFRNFCRGCEFELGNVIDWSQVTTVEVLTGPALVASSEAGLPDLGLRVQNPFALTAIDQWESLLLAGHRITAVSGSDSKGVEGEARRMWGTNATAVYAEELSRPALMDALRAGHAYVRTRGEAASPAVELTAVAPDGTTGIYGDTLVGDSAQVTVTVTGGQNQLIQLSRNGNPLAALPVLVTSDPFTYTFTARRDRGSEGPLGTFWRVDVLDPATLSLSTIGNPIFLADPVPGGSTTTPPAAS